MSLKVSPAKWKPFRLGLNVLNKVTIIDDISSGIHRQLCIHRDVIFFYSGQYTILNLQGNCEKMIKV